MNILAALEDKHLFKPHFRGDSWEAWKVCWAPFSHGSGLYGPLCGSCNGFQ